MALGLVLVGCQPAVGPGTQSGTGLQGAQISGPRTLVMGMTASRWPRDGIIAFAGTTGMAELTHAFHAGLTTYGPDGGLLPRIAQKVPRIEDGDWRLASDGQMEIIWKLRPNIKWHDGTPVTAADFVFGLQTVQDPDFPLFRSESARLITEISAPDPSTVVARWKQVSIYANASGPTDIVGLPRHLLADLYDRGDKQAFFNSSLWTSDFVGMGPYRLTELVEGTRLEGVAFDDYFLGRPKIDRVIYQYSADTSPLLLSLRAGAVDMVPIGSFQLPTLLEAKRGWDPTGGGATFLTYAGTRAYSFQFRNADAPWARDVKVRRSLAHMLDRQAITDAFTGGLASVADTVVAPTDPIYRLLEQRGLMKYQYDLGQAERLMGEAGWSRSGASVYRSAAGEPFVLDISFLESADAVAEAQAVGGHWKAAGVADVTFTPIVNTMPSAVQNEMRHTYGAIRGFQAREDIRSLNFITSQIGTAENRFAGNNRGGYSNPAYDGLYERAIVTLEEGPRQGLTADLLKIVADDVVLINLYYDSSEATAAVRRGIRGPGQVSSLQMVTAWNIHEWEMD